MLIARGTKDLELLPKMACRHGLIAGATGTGKTITLQSMTEQFSRLGVPVFMVDIKGDLSGICAKGGQNPKIQERINLLKFENFEYCSFPTVFWDVYGENGHPLRSTISEMGPLLLAKLLNLNDTQAGVLNLAFKVADDQNVLLLDLKDLQALMVYVGENASDLKLKYGNISSASIGAIQRGLLELETQGAHSFFGEPALCIDDLLQTDSEGKGYINLLSAEKLFLNTKLYSAFLLWLLSELYENLPEVGDVEKPKLVLFFDEAHLLFKGTSETLIEKIEQVVRLIRSKGVGVYFITQNPIDIAPSILGQLGNRVQHALRAFTPQDQKAVRSAAQTFRANPGVEVEKVISELQVGQALISFLDEKGSPSPVEVAYICPPSSQVGPITPAARQELIKSSLVYGQYENSIDRESAYEIFQKRAQVHQETLAQENQEKEENSPSVTRQPKSVKSASSASSMLEKMASSALKAASSQMGRSLIRGVLGSLIGKKGRR